MREKVVIKVTKEGRSLVAFDSNGKDWTSEVSYFSRTKAYETNEALMRKFNKNNEPFWKRVPMSEFETEPVIDKPEVKVNDGNESTREFIRDSYSLKPKRLIMNELKWKLLIRSVKRGKNIMMTGHSGCGKTMAAKSVMSVFDDRQEYYFNLGATQDPRSSLIGNTHFNQGDGTFFSESAFVKAIRTPNAMILLDEVSRAHPDAWNILMTVLDEGQRYLRLDEQENAPIVEVAEGVTFIATANIGNEYTATREMDRALLDRFTRIEMDLLDADQEKSLLDYLFPTVSNFDLNAIAQIASETRKDLYSENPTLTDLISTRMSVEISGLLYDGFNLAEAAEVAIYPFFDPEGGVDSERTYMKQLVQKWIVDDSEKETNDGDNDVSDLFSDEDINAANK